MSSGLVENHLYPLSHLTLFESLLFQVRKTNLDWPPGIMPLVSHSFICVPNSHRPAMEILIAYMTGLFM